MAEHPNATLVRESFGAMERSDMQWFDEHIADEIVWHTGGNSKAAGEVRGKQQVAQMMSAMDPSTMKADVHDILANDDHAVVMGTATVTAPSGKRATYNYVNVFHIADGKITEAWGMAENDAVTDPIWDEFAPPS
jgi:hypothetical protein